MDIHVTPINDLEEHLDTRECWCEPIILDPYEDTDDRPAWPLDVVVVHNSKDGREFVERHGLQ